MRILGIETSCDDTAAAVVEDGCVVLSSVVISQDAIHHPYGGVVPELAARYHSRRIGHVVAEALNSAGIRKEALDGVAVTQCPGLVGCLLVGFSFAKGYAYALESPWVGVNHLEGHLLSVMLTPDPPAFPYTALLVSGGHTRLCRVEGPTQFRLMGETRDDAVGEVYDKVAKMLGLGYPGGAVIESLARRGDPQRIAFPRPWMQRNGFEFSFSGLKSSVRRYIETHPTQLRDRIADIAAGFQAAVEEVLVYKVIHAAACNGDERVTLVGGVAANGLLRERLADAAAAKGMALHLPPPVLCRDNGAMIAAAGFHYLAEGRRSDWKADVLPKLRKGVSGKW